MRRGENGDLRSTVTRELRPAASDVPEFNEGRLDVKGSSRSLNLDLGRRIENWRTVLAGGNRRDREIVNDGDSK